MVNDEVPKGLVKLIVELSKIDKPLVNLLCLLILLLAPFGTVMLFYSGGGFPVCYNYFKDSGETGGYLIIDFLVNSVIYSAPFIVGGLLFFILLIGPSYLTDKEYKGAILLISNFALFLFYVSTAIIFLVRLFSHPLGGIGTGFKDNVLGQPASLYAVAIVVFIILWWRFKRFGVLDSLKHR